VDMKEFLFKQVKCAKYLKLVYDGKFIEIVKGEIDEAVYRDSNNEEFYITSECCGDKDFLKTYYILKEKEFIGFVVGVKDIIVTAYLVADTTCDYSGREHMEISKEPENVIKCAVVYYSSGHKRYVPLVDIKGW
jgi:hypothetical protein